MNFFGLSSKRRRGTGPEPTNWTLRPYPDNTVVFLGGDCSASYCFLVGTNSGFTQDKAGYAVDPTSSWTEKNFATNLLFGCTFGNSLWVTTEDTSYDLMTTIDPTGTWVDRTFPLGSNNARCLGWDGTYWICAGQNGTLSTTTDPVAGSWNTETSGTAGTINGCGYNGSDLWVIVADSGYLATASDPTGSWVSRTSSFGSTIIIDVAYGGGVWVAVGRDGKLATSPDGITWTQRSTGFGGSDRIEGVAYNNSAWVISGTAGRIETAIDPTSSWTQQITGTSEKLNVVIYDSNRNLWIVAGEAGTILTAPGS